MLWAHGAWRLTSPAPRGISPALQRRIKRRIRFSGSPFGLVACGAVGVRAFKDRAALDFFPPAI